MSNFENIKVKKGQRVTVTYEDREFDVIVIDPNGLGKDQPSLGFGFRMMDRHGGLPQATSSKWLIESDYAKGFQCLEVPTGKQFKVITVKGIDNNEYSVLEISDWVSVAGEALKAKGKRKVSDSTRNKLIDFLTWFATKGLYASAYTTLKGIYSAKDDRALSKWMMVRLEGKIKRNKYTDFLQSNGCIEGSDYAYWTDYIYQGLFGKKAWEMKRYWKVIEGTKSIARNYISEQEGLKAVAYCENQVVELFHDSLEQAHDDALLFTCKKFSSVLKKLK